MLIGHKIYVLCSKNICSSLKTYVLSKNICFPLIKKTYVFIHKTYTFVWKTYVFIKPNICFYIYFSKKTYVEWLIHIKIYSKNISPLKHMFLFFFQLTKNICFHRPVCFFSWLPKNIWFTESYPNLEKKLWKWEMLTLNVMFLYMN
jgi:hypothetical protein